MKKSFSKPAALLSATVFLRLVCFSQVNSGSNGSDGAFNPTAASTVINMATHPNGIYQFTSVNIPSGVTVTFTPNANNTPVVWLVQSNVVINGAVNVSGQGGLGAQGGLGGPGAWQGGNGTPAATAGQGPGGGMFNDAGDGANASFGTLGQTNASNLPPGPTYGSVFLIPLVGGSGGGGSSWISAGGGGGGGGGGAVEIAASGIVSLGGSITADGAPGSNGNGSHPHGGSGSGGAIRLIASKIVGSGFIDAYGGSDGGVDNLIAGLGRVRLDAYDNEFGGGIRGVVTQGFQPIIIPTAGQIPQLTVTSVGGVPVSASPTGVLSTPDAVLSAQQNNPIPIVVQCSNLPLNTPITVSVKPMNGSPVSAVGYNNTGTLASSTATILLNIPRGGGIVYATASTSN